MDNKVFVNGALATESWRKIVGGALMLFFLIPWALLIFPMGIIWFVSLGHINLFGIWSRFVWE